MPLLSGSQGLMVFTGRCKGEDVERQKYGWYYITLERDLLGDSGAGQVSL